MFVALLFYFVFLLLNALVTTDHSNQIKFDFLTKRKSPREQN